MALSTSELIWLWYTVVELRKEIRGMDPEKLDGYNEETKLRICIRVQANKQKIKSIEKQLTDSVDIDEVLRAINS